ncbi:MAG: cation:dicarboxylate symporter family transporter, partial [Alphaproteobacteria bacterium]
IAGIIIGLITNFFTNLNFLKTTAFKMRDFFINFLRKIIIPLLPIYVFGFVLKMNHDHFFEYFIKNYINIFILLIISLYSYIALLYMIAARFKWSNFINYIKEMSPAILTAFGTTSSAAAMPFTLNVVTKTLNNKAYANFIIPITVNIHMIASAFCVPFLSCALLVMTGKALPSLSQYLCFLFYYCIYAFTAAGVPAGVLLVVVGLTQKYLGLTEELTSILITVYVLQNAFVTTGNVSGNGVFAFLTYKFFKKRKMIPECESE